MDGTFAPIGRRYDESCPRWWIASKRKPQSMSPRDASHMTLPSMRNLAFFFHAASLTFARRLLRPAAFFSYALTASPIVAGAGLGAQATSPLSRSTHASWSSPARSQTISPADIERGCGRYPPPPSGTAFRTRTNFGTSDLRHWTKYSRVFTVSSLRFSCCRFPAMCPSSILLQRLQPGRLEFVARAPARHPGRVRDPAAEPEREPRVLDGAGEVPRLAELVRRLVVVVLLEELFLLAAEARRLPDDVRAFLQVRGRDADSREIELVGAVERAAVGKLVALDAPALHPCESLEVGVERRLALSDQDDVPRPSEPADAVDVDVRGDAARGHGRVLREIFGPEEALLLSRDEREDRRARGRLREMRERARDGQARRDARGAVEGAVVKRTGARLGAHANPEVIVMRGVDHGLSCAFRIRARQDTDDVAGLFLADFARERDGQGHAERDRLERAAFGRRAERVEVLPAELDDLLRELVRRPHFRGDAWRAVVRQLEQLARPGRLDDLPAVARRRRRVDDDRARGVLLRGHEVLVVPAAVPEPRLPREQVRLGRIPLRVVVHHEEDLPLEVRVLVVVPSVLGRDDAVPHEDDLRGVDPRLRLLDAGDGDEVLAERPAQGPAAGLEDGRIRRGPFDADERDLLDPPAARRAGLQAEALQLRLDVRLGEPVPARRGPAPFEEIRGEKADVRAEEIGRDRARRGLLGRGDGCVPGDGRGRGEHENGRQETT